MNLFSKLLLVALFISSAHASTCENYILIHGIGGSGESFGSLKELLEKNSCNQVYTFEYETQDSQLSILDFSKDLDLLVKSIPATGKKDLNFIMHSQGGLVGLTWMINSHQNEGDFSRDNLKRLNRYISLSTPFWGSDMALIGKDAFFSLGVKDNFISPFGEKQLIDMKYGSEFYYDLFDYFTSSSLGFRDYIKQEVRVLNIRGMTPSSKRIRGAIESQFFEGDLAVNSPSMKLDINYVDLTLHKRASAQKIKVGLTAEASGTHVKVTPFEFLGHGIASLPASCLIKKKCKHQGYQSLRSFIDEKKALVSNQKIADSIRGFDIHMAVKVPSEMGDAYKLSISLKETEKIKLSNYRFDGEEISPINIIQKDGYKVAYFLAKGTLKKQIAEADLNFSLNYPGVTSRPYKAVVRKGEITFAKLKFSL